jgi:hypothetical protein
MLFQMAKTSLRFVVTTCSLLFHKRPPLLVLAVSSKHPPSATFCNIRSPLRQAVCSSSSMSQLEDLLMALSDWLFGAEHIWSPPCSSTRSLRTLDVVLTKNPLTLDRTHYAANLSSFYFLYHRRKLKQTLYTPWGLQEVEAHRFPDSRHMKVVMRLSALRTGRLYPPRRYPWCSFLLEAESTPGP